MTVVAVQGGASGKQEGVIKYDSDDTTDDWREYVTYNGDGTVSYVANGYATVLGSGAGLYASPNDRVTNGNMFIATATDNYTAAWYVCGTFK